MTQEVRNGTGGDLTVRGYSQLQRTELHDPNEARFVYTYTGGAFYSPADKYKKVAFDEMRKERLNVNVSDGWIAMMQHYFVAAWVPPRGQPDTFYTNVLADSRYIIGKYSPAASLAPGATHIFEDGLYIGPKLPERLAVTAPGLDLTVDYGMLAIIAQPIHWLLSKIHSVVGNWGWSIIILTILIKGGLLPVVRDQLQVHGPHATGHPAHPGTQGPLRRRQGAPQPGDDGAVQEGEDQSRWGAACPS